MRSKSTTYMFILILLIGCTESNTTSDLETLVVGDYSWDTYRVSETRNEMTYSVIQLPIDYYLRKNMGVKNQAVVDSLANELKMERVIIAQYAHSSKKDVLGDEFTDRNYEDAVKYIASPIQDDYAFVTYDNDTIRCSGVLFERNFNVAPFKRVLLYFNGVDPNDTGKLLYKDRLFGNGDFQFNLNERPIKS